MTFADYQVSYRARMCRRMPIKPSEPTLYGYRQGKIGTSFFPALEFDTPEEWIAFGRAWLQGKAAREAAEKERRAS